MSLSAWLEVPVSWGDCDPAEIVFYPNYFRWFDAGTWHLMATAGLPPQALYNRPDFAGMPVLDAQSRFVKPSRFGETISVHSRILDWSEKTFRVGHHIYNAGELAVEGGETRIWVRKDATGRVRGAAIPPDVVERFGTPEGIVEV